MSLMRFGASGRTQHKNVKSHKDNQNEIRKRGLKIPIETLSFEVKDEEASCR